MQALAPAVLPTENLATETLPTEDLATEAQMRAARPPVSYICDTAAAGGVGLFVGDRRALADPGILAAQGIGTVINCAVNLDVNAVVTPDPGTAGPMAVGWAHVRYYKLGIIDGAGNPPGMVLAGYLQLAGALAQVIPAKPSYPLRATGNVLVNCRGGRSRSVTVLALWLALHRADLCPSLEAAVALIRRQRLLHPDEWHEAPKPALLDAARWAANVVRQLPPEP